MLLHLTLLFGAACASSATFPLELPTAAPEPRDFTLNYRLPTSLKPIHYDLTLEPFFDPDFYFQGRVVIEIEVIEATSSIILHGRKLTVMQEDVHVKILNAVDYIIVNALHYDDATRFYHIELNEELTPGSFVVIEIDYTGLLNDENTGFYRASYEEDGVTKWFGTTQFESNSAREAFPCFDEPALKATFQIHIIRRENYNSISNMDIEDTNKIDSERFKDTFKTSVKMSTYLVAFVVSEMSAVRLGNHAVYAAKHLIDDGRGKFAVETGVEVIRAMEEFTGVPYSLDKMYQVAIPDRFFGAGAMENWGLVTYKERYLLFKDGKTTSAEKERIVSIIAHEFGHQWFGNLVSPSWWEYIWLNEGFATYFEYYAASTVDPSMRMMEQFVTATLEYAFEADGVETTRPMSSPAESTTEISSLFDRVAYDKSGSVIRMMEHFLTTPVFKRGLNIYLTNKQFDAASPIDLWNAMQQALGQVDLGSTVADIMETWNSNAGYPVVTAGRSRNGFLTLTQSRFLLHKANHEDKSIWSVPINLARGNGLDFTDTTPLHWLRTESEETNIAIDEGEMIILNKQQTGYYRVNYDAQHWNLIIDFLNSPEYTKIHVLNRAQLLDDAFNLARSGRLEYETALRLSTYLTRESDYIPFHRFFRALQFLNNHMAASSTYGLFKRFVKELLQNAYNHVGSEATGDHIVLKNRINIIDWLCKFEDATCTEAMHDKLVSYTAIHPDLQTPVYCGGLRSAPDTNVKWIRLYSLYHEESVETLERSRLLGGMGCTFNTLYLKRMLSMAVDQAAIFRIKPEDRAAAFSAVYTSSDVGLETAFDYLIENFRYLKSTLTRPQIVTVVSGIASRVTTLEKLTKLQNFVDAQSSEDADIYGDIFTSALSTIQSNIQWSDKYVPEISEFLESYYKEEESTTEETTEVPTEQTTEVPTEQTTEVPTEQTTEVSTEQTTEVSTEQTTEQTEPPTQQTTNEPTDQTEDSTPGPGPTTPVIETTTPDGASFIMASLPLLAATIILNVVA